MPYAPGKLFTSRAADALWFTNGLGVLQVTFLRVPVSSRRDALNVTP